jgi:mannose-6-phosphate isomerase-like protein (cupin superfamily)
MMQRIVVAGLVLASLPVVAQTISPAAKTPFTAVENLSTEKTVRHLSGKELGDVMKKGMTPGAFYSQVMLSKHDGYQIINTIRDKDGQAEIHADWNDNIFVQEGEASFVTGGSAVDAKVTAPGEQRGTAIKGGANATMRAGDYFFVPAGTPHQVKLAPGQRLRFIAFKTHK